MKTPKLENTKNYSIFEMHECNRDLKEKPELIASMKKYGFMPSCPIHVKPTEGGKLTVIRGHHRLDCAKRLGLPVYYVSDDTNVDIFDLEGDSGQLWNLTDFATARAGTGDKHYVKLITWAKKNRIPIGQAASLLHGESAGSHNAMKQIKKGSFTTKENKHSEDVAWATSEMIEAGVSFAKSSTFIAALSKCLRVKEFDVRAFVSKVRLYPSNLNKRSSINDMISEIESLYNYAAKSTKNRIPLAFLARQVGLKRQTSFGKEC